MRTFVFSTLALAVAMVAGLPEPAACLSSLQPDMPYSLFGEESGSYLGIDTRDITHERMIALKLKEERGVEITMVDQDAPAGKAGLREQDVILSFNGQPVEGVAELRRMIHETPPGRTVTLGISRNGQLISLKARLADRHKMFQYSGIPPTPAMPVVAESFAMPPMPPFDMPAMDVIVHSAVRGGLMVENLTPQLGDVFGVKNGQGVLVRSVEKGSAAERSGLRAGDVIVRVGDHAIADVSDWRSAMRGQRSGSVPIGILRDRKPLTISFATPRQTGEVTALEPELSAHLDMGALQAEMDRMRPEIEAAERRAMNAQKEMWQKNADMRKQMEQAMRQAQEEIRSHQREIQEQSQRAAEEVQRQMRLHRKDMEKLKKQMEQWKRKAEEM